MESKVTFKGSIIKKTHILEHPEFYYDTNLIAFLIPTDYLPKLIEFTRTNGLKDYEITIEVPPVNPTDRAKKLFFKLRDRLAEASGDTSKEYKEHLYRSCIREFHKREDGEEKDSIRFLTRRELWLSTELMTEWCYEAEANISDIIPEVSASQKEIKE